MSKGKAGSAFRKALSIVLTASMLGALVPGELTGQGVQAKAANTVTVPEIGENGLVTFSYQGTGEEQSVYAKGSWDASWSDYVYFSEVDNQNHVWEATRQLDAATSYEYGIVAVYANEEGKKEEWKGDPTNPWMNSNSKIVRNPQIGTDQTATFYYYPANLEQAEDVKLLYREAGSDADYETVSFAQDSVATAIYSAQTPVLQGTYEYTLSVNGEETPDRNAASNVFTVSNITEEDSTVVSPVVNGNEVTFYYYGPMKQKVLVAGSMTNWAQDAKEMEYNPETGYFSLTLTLSKGVYEYKFIVDDSWMTDPLNEEQSNGNSAFTVDTPFAYEYRIHYYKEGLQSVDDAALWLWNTEGGSGSEYLFDEVTTLDGNQWLTAVVDLDYTTIGMIPKSKGSWNWRESDLKYKNEEEARVTDLYLVAKDDKVYTELPDVTKKAPARAILLEYERNQGDYEGWNIYTWDNGDSNTRYDFKEINGKMVCEIPVKEGREGISFCMRRSTNENEWAEKDGSDHFAPIPGDQKVTKVRFKQDQGIVEILPYNTDYDMKPAKKTVTFYYRNDDLFRTYEEDSLIGKVKVVVDDKTYMMQYDAGREQYVYDWKGLTPGAHTYYYVVGEGDSVENTESKTFTYQTFQAEAVAKLTLGNKKQSNPVKMNSRQNALLSIDMKAKNHAKIDDLVITEAYADLSRLGLSDHFVINPELKAVSISVKDTVKPGVKKIPVVVKDQFGNEYTTSINVLIVKAPDSGFDWDESVIYFTVTDRFFNGNNENDDAYGIGDYSEDKETNSLSYHGGDFAGLTQKLDYLQNTLGVNTVWITPIVENKCDGLTTDLEGVKSYGYHGYWATSFEELNRHLGSEEEFAMLVQELHKRGMKIMVDVVLNHAGYGSEEYFNSQLPDGKKMLRDETNTVKGDTVLDGLAGLPDFVTEDAEVRQLLIDWQTKWVQDYDIDYFRIDTVKHVEHTTWEALKNALTLLNPEFKMIGEYSGAGYASDFGALSSGQMDSLLDFDFNEKAQEFLTGSIEKAEAFFEDRNAAINNTAMMGQFMSSHDEDGLQSKLIHQNGLSEETAYDLMKAGASLQLTMKGQPVIYYGEEIGQYGEDNYPYQTNRYDFDWNAVEQGSDMLAHYRKLLSIRNEYREIFAKGTRKALFASDEKQAVVFERAYGQNSLYVGISIAQEKNELTFATNEKKGTVYTDLYSDQKFRVAADGSLTVTLPSVAEGGTVILKKGYEITEYESGDYNKKTGEPQKNPARLRCLTPVAVNDSRIFEAKISNQDIGMIVYELDANGKVIAVKTCRNNKVFKAGRETKTLKYVLYHRKSEKKITLKTYQNMLNRGLEAELREIDPESFIRYEMQDSTSDKYAIEFEEKSYRQGIYDKLGIFTEQTGAVSLERYVEYIGGGIVRIDISDSKYAVTVAELDESFRLLKRVTYQAGATFRPQEKTRYYGMTLVNQKNTKATTADFEKDFANGCKICISTVEELGPLYMEAIASSKKLTNGSYTKDGVFHGEVKNRISFEQLNRVWAREKFTFTCSNPNYRVIITELDEQFKPVKRTELKPGDTIVIKTRSAYAGVTIYDKKNKSLTVEKYRDDIEQGMEIKLVNDMSKVFFQKAQ